jgi:hypothetical protein
VHIMSSSRHIMVGFFYLLCSMQMHWDQFWCIHQMIAKSSLRKLHKPTSA